VAKAPPQESVTTSWGLPTPFLDTSLPLVKKLPLPRRATSVLLPPRQAPRVTVDGFRDRLWVRCCTPVAHVLHLRVLLRLT
jgi:hypothetical protein